MHRHVVFRAVDIKYIIRYQQEPSTCEAQLAVANLLTVDYTRSQCGCTTLKPQPDDFAAAWEADAQWCETSYTSNLVRRCRIHQLKLQALHLFNLARYLLILTLM